MVSRVGQRAIRVRAACVNRRRIDAIHYVWLDEEEEMVGARIARIVNMNVGIEPDGRATSRCSATC